MSERSKTPEILTPIPIPQTSDRDLQRVIDQWADQFGPTPVQFKSLRSDIDEWGLPWFRSGALVRKDGKILMMHESRVQIRNLKDAQLRQTYLDQGLSYRDWIDGDGGWNLPAGRLRPGESFEQGAERKVKAESGWKIALQEAFYCRRSNDPNNRYILPIYLANAVSGPDSYCAKGTSEIGWFQTAEIRAMSDAGLLRSPDFVLGCFDLYEDVSGAL